MFGVFYGNYFESQHIDKMPNEVEREFFLIIF